MKKIHLIAITLGLIGIIVCSVSIGIINSKPQTANALGSGVVVPFNHFGVSSSTVVLTSSKMLVATNTARTYLSITNLAKDAIFCSDYGLPGVAFKGITIFGSSTMEFTVDKNPYTGALNCIIPSGILNASTTILER